MLLKLTRQFVSDISKLKAEDAKLPAKVWDLIFDILKTPSNPLYGIGKPEALKGTMSGYYSRRITDKHRLIYRFINDTLNLVSCYGHYDDK